MKTKIKITCPGTYNNGDVDCGCEMKECPLNVDVGAGNMCNIHTVLNADIEMTHGTVVVITVEPKELPSGKIEVDGEDILCTEK